MDRSIQIRRWIEKACRENGVPELNAKIAFEFNDRFTARLGDATFYPKTGKGLIRLSGPLWQRASETDQYETVIHEACHIIVRFKNQGKRVASHGREWRIAMRTCGLEPKRTHNLDRTGLVRRRKRYQITNCPELKDCSVRASVKRNIEQGVKSYRCTLCKLAITCENLEEKDDS